MGLWDELGCHQGLPNRWQRGIQVLAATAPGARLFSLTQRHLDRVTERLTRGRVNATQVLPSWAFYKGINGGNLSVGAADALFMFPVLLGLSAVVLKLAHRIGGE